MDSYEILRRVRENNAKLASCDNHDFEPCDFIGHLPRRYRCKRCHGEVESTAVHWYEKGKEHGKVV